MLCCNSGEFKFWGCVFQVGVVGKVDGEFSFMFICSIVMEVNILIELYGEDRVFQFERLVSNIERENGKFEGVFSGLEECGRFLDGSDFFSVFIGLWYFFLFQYFFLFFYFQIVLQNKKMLVN